MERKAMSGKTLAPELERGLGDILARGGCVFPICSNSKRPLPLPGWCIGKPGKGGYKLATNDPWVVWRYFRGDPLPDGTPDIAKRTLRAWRRTASPNAAVTLDMSGMMVLDADNLEELRAFRAQYGELPATYCVRSPRENGGLHYYFRAKADSNYRRTVSGFPHLDIKHHGYVLIAGSVKRNGSGDVVGRYSAVDSSPIADPPDWLFPLIERPPVQPGEQPRMVDEWGGACVEIERARAYLAKMPGAVSGHGGHNATFAAACVLVRGFALPEEEAFDILATDYNPRCEPPWTEWELRHKVRSAIEVGGSPIGYLLDGGDREPSEAEAKEVGPYDITSLWDESGSDWGNT